MTYPLRLPQTKKAGVPHYLLTDLVTLRNTVSVGPNVKKINNLRKIIMISDSDNSSRYHED